MPKAERVNSDSIVNATGRRLIELCRSQYMLIMNGRFGKDFIVGNKICKNASTVDYIIITPNCIEYILDFEILDFDPLISDVHCPVYVDFKVLQSHKDQHVNLENKTTKTEIIMEF